jgi:Mannosyltransferase (PIG-V)
MIQTGAEATGLVAAPRLADERRIAMRDAWGAFWSSRAVVWGAAILTVLIFGWAGSSAIHLDPYGVTRPFHNNELSNLLVAPGARFDSAWYLTIAHEGYDTGSRSAFFPLLPALLSLFGQTVGSALVAGIAISSISGLGALYLLHRLVTLDFDLAHARTTVWLAAWFPGALVLSAVYSEALFLLFSVGSLYAARVARWPLAGLLGGLAAVSRSGGIVLLVPLVVIYLWGPRADRPSDVPWRGLRPRYRPRADVLWVPAGLAVYMLYLALTTGDPMAVFSAQAAWHRTFVPLGGIAAGLWSAVHSSIDLLFPGGAPAPLPNEYGVPQALIDVREIALAGFMVLGIWLVCEAARRLTPAYAAYAACGLALPLSVPADGFPLMSLPRFEFVLFPLWIALALWVHERHRRYLRMLWAFGCLLAVSSGLFATWVLAP